MHNRDKPKIVIVDENDEIIGFVDRKNSDKNQIYRVSALCITNSRDEILLARRHCNKSHDPGKWGPAVSGTVEENETYESNIIKEAEEELGIKNIKLALGTKIKVDNKYHYFTQWYKTVIDWPIDKFKIQEDEVEEIKWFPPKELKEQFQKHPNQFISSMKNCLELFLPHN